MAAHVGKILAVDIQLDRVPPARFCVGVDIARGWISTVVGHSAIGGSAIIHVFYEGLELQCWNYGHHANNSLACPRLQLNQASRLPGPPAPGKPGQGPTPPLPRDSQRRQPYHHRQLKSQGRMSPTPPPRYTHRGSGPHHRNWRCGRKPYQRSLHIPEVDLGRCTLHYV